MAGYTLLLREWDLTLDSGGNIATAQDSYGIAQNVANAVRLFTRDAYYDPERGVPHFPIYDPCAPGSRLGVTPDMSVVRSRIRRAALAVDGVTDANVEITSITDRVMGGTIALTTETGDIVDVAF